MKQTKKIHVILDEEYEADYNLEFKKDEKGEDYGILTVPYVEWEDIITSFVSNYVFDLRGRELECIEKLFFDNYITDLPIKGYPYPIEMCQFLYKGIQPDLYEKILSCTFEIDINLIKNKEDHKYYSNLLKIEKENRSAIKQFIRRKKELGFVTNSRSILYAKKLAVPLSSNAQQTIVLVDKLPPDDKYKIQIHDMDSASDAEKAILSQQEFDSIYDAKKTFDNTTVYFSTA